MDKCVFTHAVNLFFGPIKQNWYNDTVTNLIQKILATLIFFSHETVVIAIQLLNNVT